MNDRDTFAAAALTGLLSNDYFSLGDDAAKRCYEYADAMLRERGQSDRSQPIGSPAKTNPTQPRNGTPAEGSVPGEGSVPDSRNWKEPVAWAVEKKGYPPMFAVFNDWNFACRAAMEEYAEIVPLYRHPPCQDLLQKN
jgi:hypothetical protein